MDEEAAIRAALDDWNAGGFDAFAEQLAPDVVWHAPPGYPGEDIWLGRETIRKAWGDQFGTVFSQMHFEITELVRGPRRWFVASRTRMHAGSSGLDVDQTAFMVFEAEGDLATEIWTFMTEDEARAQAEV